MRLPFAFVDIIFYPINMVGEIEKRRTTGTTTLYQLSTCEPAFPVLFVSSCLFDPGQRTSRELIDANKKVCVSVVIGRLCSTRYL